MAKKIDTEKIRQSAYTLMERASEMANLARALPSIVGEATVWGGPQMQSFVEQVRDTALTAGATQETFNQTALQMIAYADRVEEEIRRILGS